MLSTNLFCPSRLFQRFANAAYIISPFKWRIVDFQAMLLGLWLSVQFLKRN